MELQCKSLKKIKIKKGGREPRAWPPSPPLPRRHRGRAGRGATWRRRARGRRPSCAGCCCPRGGTPGARRTGTRRRKRRRRPRRSCSWRRPRCWRTPGGRWRPRCPRAGPVRGGGGRAGPGSPSPCPPCPPCPPVALLVPPCPEVGAQLLLRGGLSEGVGQPRC